MLKRLNIFIISFIIIYSVYLFGIPALINSNQNFVFSALKKETGLNFDVQNFKFKTGLIPSAIIKADKISAAEDNLVLNNPYIEVNLLPLLTKKLSVKNFYSDTLYTNLTIDENNNLYIGKYPIKPVNTEFKPDILNLKLYNTNISLTDKTDNKIITFTGKPFEINKNEMSAIGEIYINNKKSDVNMVLKIPDKNNVDKTVINGYLTDLDLSALSPYIALLTNNNIEKISGIINLQANSKNGKIKGNISSENFLLKLKNIEKPLYLKEKTLINTVVKLSNKEIDIIEMNAISDNLNAQIEGKVTKSDLDLKIGIKDTLSQAVIPLIPYMNFDECEINLKKLRDYGIFSLVNGNMEIKGNIKKPSVYGSFTAKDVYVQRPLNIPKATIILDFKGDKIFFDAFAPASKTQNVKVIGNVELYDKKLAEIDISSTPTVDLKTAQIILNPLHEILDFEIGPVPIMDIEGTGNIKLKVKGNKEYPHLWGAFNFKNGTVKFNGVNAVIKNGSGRLDFKDENMHFKTYSANLNKVPVSVEGDCSTQGILNFNVISNNQSLNETLKILNTSPMFSYMNKSSQMLKAASGKINIKINLKGSLKHIKDFQLGKTIIPSGNIKLLNNDVIIGNSLFKLKNIIGNIDFNNTDINFNFAPLISEQRVHINGKIKNNKIYSKTKLNNINLKVKDSDLLIKSGEINLNGDKIVLNKINSEIDSKISLIDGDISNIYQNPKLDIYIESIPSQQFIDKYINKNVIYPLIIKGPVDYSARTKGTLDALNILSTVNIHQGSSVYYKGAIIEDLNHPLKLNIDLILSKAVCKVRNIKYSQINENGQVIPLLNANGKINLSNKSFSLENFKIKTENPTDARFFNIIFKKPLIKEGLFTSNLVLNGDVANPYIIGDFNIFGVNAPFWDTTIKDINLVFNKKTTDVKIKGEVFSNEINVTGNIENKTTPPYVINKADIYLDNFDINTFLRHLDKFNLENFDNVSASESSDSEFDIRDLIIKELNIIAKRVYVRNLVAKNFDARISLLKGILSLDKLNFVTAEGKISGDMNYNFINSKMTSSLIVDSINANTITKALFDINDQLYGDLSGEINLNCDGISHEECMKTLNGECSFSILNGKMPKLGSLEYLLKSSNIIKSGITGLTLNNIIEILTPLKSGEFESIKGHFHIENGLTNDINIASKGKDLSIFISGDYDFYTSETSLEVYGRLAKKISNGLGIIGNLSLNTLFNTFPGINLSKTNQAEFVQLINKIPGIELNTNAYRIFFVKIDGNMNSEDFDKIFKWID